MSEGQILAMGGGGFSMEPENLLLDEYLLSLAGQSSPKVCFVGTASGDAESYIERFYESFAKHKCKPSHLSLFKPPLESLEDFVLDKDIIYVGGGNTKNLIVLWREWKLDEILKKAWQAGKVLAGISAGSICWFEEGVTDSIPGKLTKLKCLGLLPGSNCPHYDGEKNRRPSYHDLQKYSGMLPGFACDDGAAIHFKGNNFFTAVSSRKDAHAYFVGPSQSCAIEEKVVATNYLG